MRRHALLLAVAVLAGCTEDLPTRKPSARYFYYPTGVAHTPGAGEDALGFLYVASSNMDRCFDVGQVHALPLREVSDGAGQARLHALNEPAKDGVLKLTELGATAVQGRRTVQSLGSEMVSWRDPSDPAAPTRLFLPSLGEGSPLHVLQAQGAALSCVGAPESESCFPGAPSLERSPEGGVSEALPRAPGPYGVGVNEAGTLYVTHTVAADSPPGRQDAIRRNYLLRTSVADAVAVAASSGGFPTEAFLPTQFPSHSVAVGENFTYVTGRASGTVAGRAPLLRVVSNTAPPDHREPEGVVSFATREFFLESVFSARESRGLALRKDETRLYLVTRFPSALLEVEVTNPKADPSVRLVRAVPLPPGAEQVRLIERPQGDLVVVSCTDAGSVALYDAGLGQVVANVSVNPRETGITEEQVLPYGLALQQGPGPVAGTTAARLFVSLFFDGRVAVVDIPDVAKPEAARMVALIGQRQLRGEGREATSCVVEE